MYDPSKPYKHEILKLIRSTWRTPYVRVQNGTYPIITKRISGREVQHSDGIGTKGIYHYRKKTFKYAVIDAFAMNANDLAMAGAIPYALQDHIVIPDAGHRAILEIVRALAALCRKYNIVITGGETSHHDTLNAVDIGITMSGFLKRVRRNYLRRGDLLIGLQSTGLHANGFTKVRGMFGMKEWREDFVRPTAIYLDTVQTLLTTYDIHGMMHITGGAFSRLKDSLDGVDAVIEYPRGLVPQPIFYELYKRGVSNRDMYTTFNCGIGFIFSVPPRDAQKIVSKTKGAYVIGKVQEGSGAVYITSAFNGARITL